MKQETKTPWQSCFYRGELMHHRVKPKKHFFRYPMFYLAVDLDELPRLHQASRWFSYNRFNLLALHDNDYLHQGHDSIRQKVEHYLQQSDYADSTARIVLFTVPRYLHYVFNPVSFYFCYKASGELGCLLAEVNNTYGERHLYIADAMDKMQGDLPLAFRMDKHFFVSPFNTVQGNYVYYGSELEQQIQLHLNLLVNDKALLYTRFKGKALVFCDKTLWRLFLQYPLTALWAIPRISWQAIRLQKKGLPTLMRPYAEHAMTLKKQAHHHPHKKHKWAWQDRLAHYHRQWHRRGKS